uniref:DOMON domain-containing protein n=1 Tax=Xenopus tropicalis TaxID=8364 RepID=A0A1B8XY04_XENTR
MGGCWGVHLQFSRVMKVRGRKDSALLRWGVDRHREQIALEVQVPRASWVALALNLERNLTGSDVVIGGWNGDTEIFYDAHIDSQWPPVRDNSQDYELLELRRNETHSTLRVWRKWFTCDPQDYDFEDCTTYVTAYFGESPDLRDGAENAFSKSIYFMEIKSEVQLPSELLYYDIKRDDVMTAPSGPLIHRAVVILCFIRQFLIPEEDTTYACSFIPLPQVATKHHIVKYEVNIDPQSDGIVHHILIYACDANAEIVPEVGDCYGSDIRYSQCLNVMFGWAVGGEDFFYPEIAGVSIGTKYDPQYVRLEIHYSNFDGISGIRDNSGIRVFYTPELRQLDAGILMAGVLTFPIQFIPPGAEAFRSYGLCDTGMIPQSLDEPTGDLTAYAFLLHAHLTAHGIRLLHYRNGTHIGSLGEDKSYDFGFQQIRYFPKPIDIKMGDQIVVECTGSTMDRDSVTYGGPSSLNEMCLGFLFYYPNIPIATCWSFYDLNHVTDALGLEPEESVMDAIFSMDTVDWDDETRAKAQRAIMESNHTVVIQNRRGNRVNETSLLPPIAPPTQHTCANPAAP